MFGSNLDHHNGSLKPLSQIKGHYLQLVHNRFLTDPFEFITHHFHFTALYRVTDVKVVSYLTPYTLNLPLEQGEHTASRSGNFTPRVQCSQTLKLVL